MLTINNTLEGYLKDVEILGNTIQDASNLADIRSVGDTVEGQELYEIPVLSRGKNLFDGVIIDKALDVVTGSLFDSADWSTTNYIRVNSDKITFSTNTSVSEINNLNFTVVMYDTNYKAIGNVGFYNNNSGTWTLIPDTKYIRVRLPRANYSNIQIEEGTQATPYEPYIEDKLTILSPVQLEKVGDVADRIIEKDGVWGVEKNVSKIPFTNMEFIGHFEDKTNTYKLGVHYKDLLSDFVMAEHFAQGELSTETKQTQVMIYNHGASGREIRFAFLKSEFPNIIGYDSAVAYIHSLRGGAYVIKSPQFIPLPHDQQVKLRTFANKTNISFGCEIEGTIKAQVPKSLGATVNTHTEQINNLNKELDRVKKLEESTVSTVTTESDFTTVEATSNGYFEDVKLEGKTLVNLISTTRSYISSENTEIHKDVNTDMTTSKTLTIQGKANKVILLEVRLNGVFSKNIICTPVDGFINTKIVLSSGENIRRIKGISVHGWSPSEELSLFNDNFILLEGDHTQNPPNGYIEGLKSVGQSASEDGADEIVVESVKGDGNLIDLNNAHSTYCTISSDSIVGTNEYNDVQFYVYLEKGAEYFFNSNGSHEVSANIMYGMQKSYNASTTLQVLKDLKTKPFTFIGETGLYTLHIPNFRGIVKDIQLVKGTTPKPYTPHQSDKKRLLYYNNETQTWEKPILRQWDSIEKHANGKYYYHQRSGEVVLNGSESWIIDNGATKETSLHFRLNGASYNLKPVNNNYSSAEFICDKFTPRSADFVWGTNTQNPNGVDEGIAINTSSFICVRVLKSKLPTQDIQGFKQWLQSNNATVVYQLAQEKVYECTNIDLITYANETNYIVESGAIVPRSTLKVHNNISNVVKILQEKVSLLENKFIEGLKQVLAGDMYSLAELLYPEDFEEVETENNIMLLPLE